MRRIRKLVVIVTVLMVVISACSSDDAGTFEEIGRGLDAGGEGDTTAVTTLDAGDGEEEMRQDDGDESTGGGSGEGLGQAGVTPVALPTEIGRDIIFTATIDVAVTDVAGAGEEASRIVSGFGGFLFGQRTTGAPNPTSVLTFKVQPSDFQAVLDELGTIGELRSQDVSANDVTERIVDLESRIATATASVDRLRALLAEAADIEKIVALESELLARETELETLRGSLRTLEDQVALATIVLTLSQAASNPGVEVAVTMFPGHDGGASCPGDEGITADTGTETTVCYEIFNVGDTWLDQLELRDPVLDIDLDDLILVFGDFETPLEPGQSVVLAAELTPERDLRTRTTISAVPVDQDGNEVGSRPLSSTTTVLVDTVDPGGIPTFSEGLERSWELLLALGRTLILILGAVIPFLWIPVAGWFAWRALRKRDAAEAGS